jgi:hypothetical protein
MTATSNQIEQGYQDWGAQLIARGFLPYLLTLMFQPMPGTGSGKLRQMLAITERLYAQHLTSVVRKPNAPAGLDRRPIWICCPDRPVFKHVKAELHDVTINDGLHLHALAFMPPVSRLRTDLATHFIERANVYRPPLSPLRRIHVEPITDDAAAVVSYARKSLTRGRFESDALLVLPRTRSEMLHD